MKMPLKYDCSPFCVLTVCVMACSDVVFLGFEGFLLFLCFSGFYLIFLMIFVMYSIFLSVLIYGMMLCWVFLSDEFGPFWMMMNGKCSPVDLLDLMNCSWLMWFVMCVEIVLECTWEPFECSGWL